MNGFALVLVTAVLGVDYGWQPSSDGRLEYIIQLEPVTLIALREGQEALSQIDPYVKDVRRFRIRVGTGMVQRVGSPNTARQHTRTAPWTPPAGVTYGWQPIDAQRLEFILQLSPERLVLLKAGEEIVGEIPAEVGNVGRFRIRSAADQLPRQGLAGFHGAASYETPAGTDPNNTGGQPVAGTPVGPPARAAAGAAPADNGAGTARSQFNATPTPQQAGPTVPGPPRLTQPGAGESPLTATPVLKGGESQIPPSRVSSGGYPAENAPVQGAPAAAQPDPRSIYAQGSNQPGGTGYVPPGSNAAPARAESWPPPTRQDNSSGWSTPTDNSQNWPPPADRTVQGTGQASAASQPGWDPGAPRSNTYVGPQFQGSAPPLQSTDQLPPAGPTYAPPYAGGGSPHGGAGQPSIGAGGGYSPFGSSSSSGAQTTAGFGSSAGYTANRPATQPGSDMVSIVSLSSKPARKAGPLDFWNSLAETATDPELAFLRDDLYAAETEKAWWPLTLAMLALFASMGGNLYMGWSAVDVYRRYLDVAEDEHEDDEYASSDRDEDREEDWTSERRRRRNPLTAGRRAVA